MNPFSSQAHETTLKIITKTIDGEADDLVPFELNVLEVRKDCALHSAASFIEICFENGCKGNITLSCHL